MISTQLFFILTQINSMIEVEDLEAAICDGGSDCDESEDNILVACRDKYQGNEGKQNVLSCFNCKKELDSSSALYADPVNPICSLWNSKCEIRGG